MFCPRCGSVINEGLKYCRSCGLPVSQISTYVATGGTASLSSPPSPDLFDHEYLTPMQRLALTIVLALISPAILAVIAEMFGFPGDLVAIPSILIPVVILWAVFHYKSVMRRRSRMQLQNASAQPSQYIEGGMPAAAELPQPQTNPLSEVSRGSVIEDPTRKLP